MTRKEWFRLTNRKSLQLRASTQNDQKRKKVVVASECGEQSSLREHKQTFLWKIKYPKALRIRSIFSLRKMGADPRYFAKVSIRSKSGRKNGRFSDKAES